MAVPAKNGKVQQLEQVWRGEEVVVAKAPAHRLAVLEEWGLHPVLEIS